MSVAGYPCPMERKESMIFKKLLYITALTACLAVGTTAAPLHAAETMKHTVLSQSSAEPETVHVKINGISPYFTYAPFLWNDTTMIPARAVMEKLGCMVDWVQETQTVKISANGKSILLTVGQSELTVDGVKKIFPLRLF